MRLINTATCEFEEFFDREPPCYAILSHRWDKEEASFQSYSLGLSEDAVGLQKILDFCHFAANHQPRYEYVWIDTCCINKHNNTELMESINSMYRWYQNAEACFVYLRDLPPKLEAHKKERRDAFRKTAWFRRGWTLQELLAPPKVVFCDRGWEVYDDKVQLSAEISDITGIAKPFLDGEYQPQQASVAMRMSWASNRQTTKSEDQAYCLLGLFNVNMPLLYGEKTKAFIRLQEEIIKHSDDESIFAWTANYSQWGMLSPSPEAFRDSGSIVNFKLAPEQRMPYEMTNKGLRFPSSSDTHAKDDPDPSTAVPMGYDTHVVELGCFIGSQTVIISDNPHAEEMWENGPLKIELQRFGPTWKRVNCNTLRPGRFSARRRRSDGLYPHRGVQRIYFVEQPDGI